MGRKRRHLWDSIPFQVGDTRHEDAAKLQTLAAHKPGKGMRNKNAGIHAWVSNVSQSLALLFKTE